MYSHKISTVHVNVHVCVYLNYLSLTHFKCMLEYHHHKIVLLSKHKDCGLDQSSCLTFRELECKVNLVV